MSAVYPTLPKLAVRDGFDEEDLTDIDDEVFIRDGKSGGLKIDDDGGVKRPLMAPRRKCKKSCNFETHKIPYRALLVPLCYGIMALIVLLGLIILCIFTANFFPMPLTILRNWLSHELKNSINDSSDTVPCTSLATKILWTRSLPKLTSESPLRSNDVNGDGVEDIIVGFSTGLDTTDTPEYVCSLYFDDQVPCMGGVLALNGKTGETVWTHWAAHAIFSVDCGLDLTNDKTNDCVISGRGGILHAINGRDGSSIWEIPVQELSASEERRVLDVYDAKFIADVDGDGTGDVIASHAVQSGGIRTSEILIISGTNGNVIHSAALPDTEQLFLAPQILVHPDGEGIFVLITSSQKQSGGLYIVPQVMVMYGDLKLQKLHHDTGKGALLPPILVDITLDSVEDIVAAMFNSTIIAYNGLTFEPIWNYTIPNSEVISIPIPGYYNDDDVPDFMVKHQIGAGFPTYYYTSATIIDGKTGKPLLEKPMEDSLSRQMSGLSVTVEGFGNDWFLHWSVDCLNYEGVKEKYQFMKRESLISETRADLCKLRFNSTLTTNLYALSQHVGPPGISLYFSEDWRSLEFNNSLDPRMDSFTNVPRSPRVHKSHWKGNAFRSEGEDAPEIGRYKSEAAYSNYDEYKGRKKVIPNDVPGENGGDLNVDYSWKRPSKWTRENMRADKDYDISYDGENNENIEDVQGMDYPQVDEIREQRSDTDNELSNLEYVDEPYDFERNANVSLINETNDLADDYIGSDDDLVLQKREVRFIQEVITDYENSTKEDAIVDLIMKKVTRPMGGNRSENLNSTLNTTATYNETRSENEELSAGNLTEDVLSSIYLIQQNETVLNISEEKHNASNEIVQETKEDLHVYSRIFANGAQSAEEDASIEKIFKRESLKNVNKMQERARASQGTNKKRRKREDQKKKKHQAYGIQKQPPTGILLPTIAKVKGKTAVDLVFSTFWLPSSEISVILLQEDLDCIHRKKVLSENKFQYKENEDIVKECLAERGVNYKIYEEAMDRENFKIALGQMTVYRMRLECVCPEDMLPHQSCKNISSHQSWPEHLGFSGNGYFRPLRKGSTGKFV